MGRDEERPSAPDPDAPPSAEELAQAEALRGALADPSRPSASADFARAISLAHAPRPLGAEAHRAIVEQGIARGEARRRRARSRWGRASMAIAGGVAMAAAIALVLGRPSADGARRNEAEPLVPVRSTQSLFREPFARTGGESARIDRIASARAADLRDNRFAAWGVK